jgi:hypothetical protein
MNIFCIIVLLTGQTWQTIQREREDISIFCYSAVALTVDLSLLGFGVSISIPARDPGIKWQARLFFFFILFVFVELKQ